MAEQQTRNQLGVVDKRGSTAANRGRTGNLYSSTFAANTRDIASMRARLTAISATTYTTARLNAMTENDMIYAIRLADEAASI